LDRGTASTGLEDDATGLRAEGEALDVDADGLDADTDCLDVDAAGSEVEAWSFDALLGLTLAARGVASDPSLDSSIAAGMADAMSMRATRPDGAGERAAVKDASAGRRSSCRGRATRSRGGVAPGKQSGSSRADGFSGAVRLQNLF